MKNEKSEKEKIEKKKRKISFMVERKKERKKDEMAID